jgi:tRNA threonylcarbamoyl adenosine modification protein YeaZ
MKILALEFSSSQRSVAVVQTTPHEPGKISASEVIEASGRSTKAFEMIDKVLHLAQFEREQIDCLAIGLGPGSYTGIRSAIALAQGWQLALGVKLLGISTAECLAEQARLEGMNGPIAVIIDAQRNEFYLGTFDVSQEGVRPIEPLRLASFSQVQQCEKVGNLLVGPEVTNWFPGGRIIFPRAMMIGRSAIGRIDFVSGEQIEPIYLRETAFVKAPRSPGPPA